MQIIAIDFRDARIRYYDEREISKGFDSVGEANGEEIECEVRRGE